MLSAFPSSHRDSYTLVPVAPVMSICYRSMLLNENRKAAWRQDSRIYFFRLQEVENLFHKTELISVLKGEERVLKI